MKVGDEVTIMAHSFGRAKDRPLRIIRISRILQTKVVGEDGKSYHFRDNRIVPVLERHRTELAAEEARKEERRTAMEERGKKHGELNSLCPSGLWIQSSTTEGHYDLCGFTEDRLRTALDMIRTQHGT